MKVNYHTHSHFCDGKKDPASYVKEAIKRGFSSVGFTSHAPLREDNDWTMSSANLNEYLETIDSLKDEFSGIIKIHKGMEIDYFPDENRFDFFKKCKLDFSIGSVHLLYVKKYDRYFSVDESPEEFEITMNDIFGSIEEFTKTYYSNLRDMIIQGGFDILGHIDLIKKFNKDFKYFTEKEPWYIEEVIKTLDILESRDIIVEVNTGAISRGVQDVPYPSSWILKECFKRDIKVCLNSDVHHPDNIECFFTEALEMIKDAGYKQLHTPFEIIDI